MRLQDPDRFELSLKNNRYTIKTSDGGNSFTSPANQKVPKLYTVSDAKAIFYIGVTCQSMTARLNYGFNANGKNGYHGYAWRQKDSVNLDVWHLAGLSRQAALKDLECIEAEVVYLVRLRDKQWPAFQTEIHFHKSSEFHRNAAERIYACLHRT